MKREAAAAAARGPGWRGEGRRGCDNGRGRHLGAGGCEWQVYVGGWVRAWVGAGAGQGGGLTRLEPLLRLHQRG